MPGMASAATAPMADGDRADGQGRDDAVRERLRRSVAALRAEHRGQDGDAEHAADLADGVGGAGRLALLLAAARRRARRWRPGRRTGPCPTPASRNGGTSSRVGDGRRERRRPASRARSPAAPARRHQHAAADPVGRGCPRSARRASASPSTAASAGPPRSGDAALHDLQVLGRAGRSSRTSRSTSAATPGWPPRTRGCGRSAAAASASASAAPRRRTPPAATAPTASEPTISGCVQPARCRGRGPRRRRAGRR